MRRRDCCSHSFSAGILASRRTCPQSAGTLHRLCRVLLLVNYPIFTSFSSFLGNFAREVDFSVHGEAGLTRRVPHGVYTAVFLGATNPVIWILLGIYYLRFWKFI